MFLASPPSLRKGKQRAWQGSVGQARVLLAVDCLFDCDYGVLWGRGVLYCVHHAFVNPARAPNIHCSASNHQSQVDISVTSQNTSTTAPPCVIQVFEMCRLKVHIVMVCKGTAQGPCPKHSNPNKQMLSETWRYKLQTRRSSLWHFT